MNVVKWLSFAFRTSVLFFFLTFVGVATVQAQAVTETALKQLLTSRSFVFRAQSAWPLQGTVVQLSQGFDARVMGDSISTYLPYFGRSFQMGYAASNGISFVSQKFEYKLKEKTKGGWELLIKPTDNRDVYELAYAISTNGYATLQVLSNNRQAISFYGFIERLNK